MQEQLPSDGVNKMNNEGINILPLVQLINIKDFAKVQLMVAQIKEVKEHPNADKLYILQVDTGPGGMRQIVAGIRRHYTPEQLINRRIVLVANLEPAQLRGEISNGMLLAASDNQGSSLLTPDRDVALGSLIK